MQHYSPVVKLHYSSSCGLSRVSECSSVQKCSLWSLDFSIEVFKSHECSLTCFLPIRGCRTLQTRSSACVVARVIVFDLPNIVCFDAVNEDASYVETCLSLYLVTLGLIALWHNVTGNWNSLPSSLGRASSPWEESHLVMWCSRKFSEWQGGVLGKLDLFWERLGRYGNKFCKTVCRFSLLTSD